MIPFAERLVYPHEHIGLYVTVNSWGYHHDLTDRIGLVVGTEDHYIVVDFDIDGKKITYLVDLADITIISPIPHGGEE